MPRARSHSGRNYTFILLLVFVVSAAGSAFFTYRYFGGVQAKPLLNGPLYDTGEYIVDLRSESGGGAHILKTSISLQTNGYPVVRALRQRDVEVRDIINRILRNRTLSSLVGKAGMDALEHDIAAALEDVLGDGSVSGVYFPEWVMQ